MSESNNPKLTVIENNKTVALDAAKDKINAFKYALLCEALEYRNISFEKNAKDYNALKLSLKDNLDEKKYQTEVLPIIRQLDEELANVFMELKNGSSETFTNFIKNKYEKIVKPIDKSDINDLKNVFNINITEAGKIALKDAKKVYKLKQGNKARFISTKNNELNKIMQELEVTRDNNGKITNTRFNNEVVEEIKRVLKENHVSYKDTGYLSLRSTIYNLDYETKLLVANAINKKMGGFIDIGKRLTPYDVSFFTKINEGLVKPVAAGVSIGAAGAAVINNIDPAILSGPINGFANQYLVNSSIAGLNTFGRWLVGLGGTALTFGLERLPYVGSFFESTFRLENIVGLGVAGGTVALAGVALLNALKLVKRLGEWGLEGIEQSKLKKKDAELYEEEIKKEYIRVLNDQIENSKQIPDLLIIDLVNKYAKELNISINKESKNIKELKNNIKNTNNPNKESVLILLDSLVELKNKDLEQFLTCFAKSMKYENYSKVLDINNITVEETLAVGGFLPYIKKDFVKEHIEKEEDKEEMVNILKNCIYENNVQSFINISRKLIEANQIVPIEEVFNGIEYDKLEEFSRLLTNSNLEIDKNVYLIISKSLLNKINENSEINNLKKVA